MLVEIAFEVNGESRSITRHPMTRLLDVLREECALTGTKEGCGEGECGACSVFVDGALTNSCLVPIAQIEGCRVETIEGLANGAVLHPVQAAFVAHGGAQCGICTPGMIMAAVALLRERPNADEADIRAALAGNLCRCTGYVKIVDSVLAVVSAWRGEAGA